MKVNKTFLKLKKNKRLEIKNNSYFKAGLETVSMYVRFTAFQYSSVSVGFHRRFSIFLPTPSPQRLL